MTETEKEEHRSALGDVSASGVPDTKAGGASSSEGGGPAASASSAITSKMKGRGRGRGLDEEERKSGSVDRAVWEEYVGALGGTWRLVATTVLLAAAQGLTTGGDWWVSVWSAEHPVGRADNLRYELVFVLLLARGVLTSSRCALRPVLVLAPGC